MTASIAPDTQLIGLANRTPYKIDRFIARGGEGEVYALKGRSSHVAKIYRTPMDPTKTKKLVAMIRCSTPNIVNIAAWPVDIVQSKSKQPVGFIMPFIQDGMPLHMILNPKTRLQHRPNHDFASLVRIAQNTASAVSTLHQAGVVIGDMNGQNFLVLRNGTVRAIDCDSMQIGGGSKWGSQVGVEEYTAPELQGLSLKNVTRTKTHDNFALAVLLFEILVLGRHPFAGNDDLEVGEAIKRARHIFATNGLERSVFNVLGFSPDDILTPEIVDCFGRAFDLPRKKKLLGSSPQRPDAGEWAVALAGLANQLAVCPKNAAHHYNGSAKSCPWCALEKRGVPKFFTPKVPDMSGVSQKPSTQKPHFSIWGFTAKLLRAGGRLIGKIIYMVLASLIELIAPFLYAVADRIAETFTTFEIFIEKLFLWTIRWTIWWAILAAKIAAGIFLLLFVLKLLSGDL